MHVFYWFDELFLFFELPKLEILGSLSKYLKNALFGREGNIRCSLFIGRDKCYNRVV